MPSPGITQPCPEGARGPGRAPVSASCPRGRSGHVARDGPLAGLAASVAGLSCQQPAGGGSFQRARGGRRAPDPAVRPAVCAAHGVRHMPVAAALPPAGRSPGWQPGRGRRQAQRCQAGASTGGAAGPPPGRRLHPRLPRPLRAPAWPVPCPRVSEASGGALTRSRQHGPDKP